MLLTEPAIPPRLDGRPRHGAYPIPYTILVADGVPDFRCVDLPRVNECFRRRLCGMCGQPLDLALVSLGPVAHFRERLPMLEPGMHEACARYAASACPFLTGERGRRERGLPDVFVAGTELPRVGDLWLGWSFSYRVVPYPGRPGVLAATVARWERLERLREAVHHGN